MSALAFDPQEHRRASLAQWEGAAPGWERRQEQMREFSRPVMEWLLAAVDPQPGQRLLDLAAGVGETGCMAARLVAPGGTVLLADQAEAMVAAAGRRAQALGLENVQCLQLNAEWLDVPLGRLDAIVCRWGLMLMADPGAALTECRRVLRPGGRIALAVWGAPQRNPWATVPVGVLIEQGLMPAPPQPAAEEGGYRPGMFALAQPEALTALLQSAGFTEMRTETVALVRDHSDFDEFWETTLDVSPGVHDALMHLPQQEIDAIHELVRERLKPFTAADGALAIPAEAVLAAASA